MSPILFHDFTPILSPAMLSAAAVAILGVVAVAVAAFFAEQSGPATRASYAPRIETNTLRPAA